MSEDTDMSETFDSLLEIIFVPHSWIGGWQTALKQIKNNGKGCLRGSPN